MNHIEPPAPQESVAIIGMKGRFPGARNIEQFWDNLRSGVESITRLRDDELLAAGMSPELLQMPQLVKAGSYLEDIDLFDALFFGFSARDAEIMDPQQRLFLEIAWEALEGAGYYGEGFPGLIGVFGGTEMSHYLFNLYAHADRLAFVDNFQMMVGNDKDHLTTHVSYKLNLRGPSVVCQTACSTSLVAVTLAYQSLLTYQCDIALAGGVAISLPQRQGYFYQPGAIVSPDGHCRPFDAAAQGTVGGNGVGMVVLRRLSEALADGDHIHAVIRGAAINNDGSLKAGYTAPSIEGQAQCIALAQAMAGVTPETITYLEAHGTATPLGDPIEIAALTEVFRAQTENKQFCSIGSVKSNVGHLNAAAGVTGLMKAALAIEHGELPPSLHYRAPNPEIDFPNSPFHVQTELSPWKVSPRRAGVNSFGIGGTNAHVVLEEAPTPQPGSLSRPWQLVLLSARTASALEKATDNLAGYLRQHSELALPDVGFTLQMGRKPFSHRRMVVTSELTGATNALETRDSASVFSAQAETVDRPVAFLFPGQGVQYPNMALELYNSEPVVRETIDACAALFQPALGYDLRTWLFPADHVAEAARQLRLTATTQAVLFTVEYAVAQLWIKWGIQPAAMIGHSIGEYVAACLAGVLSLEDAVAAVALRGQLMQALPQGAMLGVPLGEREVQRFLNPEIALAAVNAPGWTVLSGPFDAIARLAAQFNALKIAARPLHTSHAFHSSMIDPVVRPFVQHMQSMALQPPTIPYLSNVTGTWITPSEAMDPAYYGRQLRQTVRFSDGLQALIKDPRWIWLEVGPGRTLSSLGRQHFTGTVEPPIFASLPSAQDSPAAMRTMIETLGSLWLHGIGVDWTSFYENERRRRVPLPTYPFERQRYWIGEPETTAAPASAAARDITQWFYAPSWKQAAANCPVSAAESGRAPSTWLVLSDGCGVGAQLATRVRATGHEVITVNTGNQFARTDSNHFTVRPDHRSDYEAMLANLRQSGHTPTHILHLWSVTRSEDPGVSSAPFDSHQRLGFLSLVKLAQALERQKFTESMQIGVVTNRAQLVLGDEPLNPGKATILGAVKVLAQEYPHCRCRAIDLSLDEGQHSAAERLAAQLEAELTRESFAAVVAYRRGRRWVQTFEPLPLQKQEGLPPILREGGVYLITGGLGKIGLTLAEVLTRSAKAKLVLVGRSGLPARDTWPDYLKRNAADSASAKIQRIIELEDLGSEVLVLPADVSNRDQMRYVLDKTLERFGALHGVIHGAGNTSAEAALPLNQTDEQSAPAHFLPKAQGLCLLEELLRGHNLDFVVLLSSLSSVLGGLGFTAYAAGNAFLDAFAASRQTRADGYPWISVNWDAWQFPGDPAIAAASFTDFIRPADGQEAFLRILNASARQVVVSTSDLQARLDQWVYLSSLRPNEGKASGDRPKHHARPNLSSQYAPPRDRVEEDIASVWENLLGVAPVGIHDKFFELGGHSLLAIQLISRLREMFQVEMPVQRLFEAPTIAELAALVREQMAPGASSDAAMEEILSLVEGMSEEEVRALLAQEQPVAARGESPSEGSTYHTEDGNGAVDLKRDRRPNARTSG